MNKEWLPINSCQSSGPEYTFHLKYLNHSSVQRRWLLVGISIQSVLDEDNTRQMLPDAWIMLNVTKPARHVKIFLLFLNCQVNLSRD